MSLPDLDRKVLLSSFYRWISEDRSEEIFFPNVTWKEHCTTRSWTFVFYFSPSSHSSFPLFLSYLLMSGKYFSFFFLLRDLVLWQELISCEGFWTGFFLFFHYWFSVLVKLLILVIRRKHTMAFQNTDLYCLFLLELFIFSVWTRTQ